MKKNGVAMLEALRVLAGQRIGDDVFKGIKVFAYRRKPAKRRLIHAFIESLPPQVAVMYEDMSSREVQKVSVQVNGNVQRVSNHKNRTGRRVPFGYV